MTQTLVTSNVGNYLLNCLYDCGVKHIFGIPGDYVLQFDKLIEQHKIKYVNATSENSAGNMADTYGRLLGLGVVCITYGVGINISNALAQAYAESSPLVIISGAPSLSEYDKGQKLHHLLNKNSILHQMDTTQLEIFSHFTIDQAILTSAQEAKAQIDRVLWNCQKHKKPVYIEIPRGMPLATLPPIVHEQETSHNLASFQSTSASRAIALHPILEQVKHLLQKSKRPIIWAGHEILRYHLSSALIAFAVKNQIPIASTLLGKTVIDENHPICLGVYQGKMSRPEVRDIVEKGDCLLMLGGILSDVDTGIYTAELNHQHKIFATTSEIVIDGQSYYGLDFADFIQALSETDFNLPRPSTTLPHPQKPEFTPIAETPITSKRLFECIASQLTDQIVATDFGDSIFGSSEFILKENSFISCAYFASIGFGTPAAIAAQLAIPERRTIGIVGDGAFQMTATELSTAARYNLDPIMIVLNNHGYGTERPLLEGEYNEVHDWNYSFLPKLLNCGIGIKVSTEDAFDTAFKEALKQRGQFHLIEVELGKTDFSPALDRFLSFVNENKNK
jgi:indolepyruvate decarboxylase